MDNGEIMKQKTQYIEVIEKDSKGTVLGKFAFWGKMTIRLGKTTVSINAPGYHEDDNLAVAVDVLDGERAISDSDIEKIRKWAKKK